MSVILKGGATNLLADVAAASTAAVVSQQALVVTLSPNTVALPLPSGAATAALQTTGNGYLQSIAAGTPAALGQTTMQASAPVAIASNQSAIPVTGTFFQATQPVSGTFFQATQPVSGTVAATQSGTWTMQPGNTPNTSPWLATINQGGNSATVSAGGALKVDGSAVTQPISGTITANAGTGTFAISAASLPLPASAATSALQTSGNSTLTSISGQLPTTLGAKTTANSMAVNIASDQTVPVSGTFFQSTQPISATSLPLPTGAATSALQTSGNSSLTTLATNLPAQGQALMAASLPVTIASNQSSLPVTGAFFQATQPVSGTVTANAGTGTMAVSAASLPLPTGAATSANQTTVGTQTTQINDGVRAATIKAASTAAGATDTALVVAVSPNNTVAVSTVATASTTTLLAAQASVSNSTGPTVTSSSSVVLAANAARKGASFFNPIGQSVNVYLFKGATATTAAGGYTTVLFPGELYELPPPVYTGAITAITSSSSVAISVGEDEN